MKFLPVSNSAISFFNDSFSPARYAASFSAEFSCCFNVLDSNDSLLLRQMHCSRAFWLPTAPRGEDAFLGETSCRKDEIYSGNLLISSFMETVDEKHRWMLIGPHEEKIWFWWICNPLFTYHCDLVRVLLEFRSNWYTAIKIWYLSLFYHPTFLSTKIFCT